MAKPKVVCIGAAVQDVFMLGSIFKPKRDGHEQVEVFQLGSKNSVDDVIFSTGGGASNASVTFVHQGLHSYYMGQIGHDAAGRSVMDELHHYDVDTSLVDYSRDCHTGYSVLLLAPSGERTILTYRGASTHYKLSKSDFHSTRPDWFYLSSVDGNFELLHTVWNYAQEHGIKIAFNPGKKELAHPVELKKLLKQCMVLSLNKDELAMLYEGDKLEDLVRSAARDVPYVVGTDGPKGSVATDGHKVYHAGMYKDTPVIDRTGAGDAFSSGFVAMIAQGASMEQALTFASANSTSVVGKIGAKAGILPAHARIDNMTIKSSDY